MIHKSPLIDAPPMDGPPMDGPFGGRPDDPSARHRAPRRVVRLGLARHMSLLIGGILLLFGGLQWLPAASLTVLGWAGWLSAWRGWFGLAPLVVPGGGPFLGLSFVVGLLYSIIEVEAIPVRWQARRLMVMSAAALLAWLFLAGTDIVSTYAGLAQLPPSVPAWARQATTDPLMRGIVAIYLTFAPDRAMITGYRLIRRAMTP